MTGTQIYATALTEDQERLAEDVIASLTPATRSILAAAGAGDPQLRRTLLGAMPTRIVDLLQTRAVLDDDGELTTPFGAAVSELLAHQEGIAEAPEVRQVAERQMSELHEARMAEAAAR